MLIARTPMNSWQEICNALGVPQNDKLMVQRYIPHSSVLYKIYVVQDCVHVLKRDSLDKIGIDRNNIKFNSQKMSKENYVVSEQEMERLKEIFSPVALAIQKTFVSNAPSLLHSIF